MCPAHVGGVGRSEDTNFWLRIVDGVLDLFAPGLGQANGAESGVPVAVLDLHPVVETADVDEIAVVRVLPEDAVGLGLVGDRTVPKHPAPEGTPADVHLNNDPVGAEVLGAAGRAASPHAGASAETEQRQQPNVLLDPAEHVQSPLLLWSV